MLEILILVVLSVALGVVWALVVRAMPQADPARAASKQVAAGLAKRPAVRRFLRARIQPETATGLGLTIALVALLITGVVFGILVAMIRTNSGVVNIDVAVTRWAAAHATGASLGLFGWLTQIGSTIGTIVVSVGIIAYATRARARWTIALFVILVVGGQSALVNIIKVTVGRVRPDLSPFHLVHGPAFPSGHAAAAAATWAVVALVLGRTRSPRLRAIFAGVGVAIAVAVACTRVFLGAHWTSDVVGGLILGWTWFGLCSVAFGGRVLRLGAPAKEAATGTPPRASADTHAPAPK